MMKDNEADLQKLNDMELTAKIGIVLGDTVQPVETIRESDDWKGEYTLEGTTYYLTGFTMLKPGGTSNTSTGYIQKEYVSNPLDLPKKDASADTANVSSDKSGGTASQASGLAQIQAAKNQINIEVGPGLHETETVYRMSGANMQSIPTYNKPITMHSIETNAEIVRNYVPDTAILPSPNIQCYVNVPVKMTPEVRFGQCQMAYTYIEHGLKDCGWLGGGVRLLHDVAVEKVDPTVYTKSVEAFNVYYIQTIQFAVNFASIYEWQPDPMTGDPAEPPIEIIHPPTELKPQPGGDKEFIIHEEFPTVMDLFLNMLMNPIFWVIALVAIAVFVVFIILYMKQFSMFNNPQKLIGKLSTMMGGFGAPQAAQPIIYQQPPNPNQQQFQQLTGQQTNNPPKSANAYGVIVNSGSKYLPITVTIIITICIVIATTILNNIFHFF
jgi:hypothetical protein